MLTDIEQRRQASPPVLMPAPMTRKLTTGGHRIVAASDTFARAKRLLEPLGITRVANVTGLDCVGIPVVTVARPNARSLAVSQGKGLTLDAARASGVMEAIELYHAERVELPLRLASWNELRFSHQLADVARLPRVSPSAFTPNRQLLWVEGTELLSGQRMWLPYEAVHINLTVPFPSGTGCFILSSNGLASGNHPLEAMVHGICEVIERDAATLHLSRPANEQAVRRVDLGSVGDADCRHLLRLYEDAGVAVAVWDMTTDIRVAAFRCVIVDRDPSPVRPLAPVEGFGCHLVREAALARALTEAAQARLTLITGSRDDNLPELYAAGHDAAFIEHSRLEILKSAVRSFGEAPSYETSSLEEDLAILLRSLRGAGIEQVIAVDLSKPGLDIPVFRIVAPSLEPYHGVSGGRGGLRALRASGVVMPRNRRSSSDRSRKRRDGETEVITEEHPR